MSRQKQRPRHQYQVIYTFDTPASAIKLSLTSRISFQSNLEPEHLEIKDNVVTLQFSRAERQKISHILNNERHLEILNRVQCCYALEGLGVPRINSIRLREDNNSLKVEEKDYPHLAAPLLRESTAIHKADWVPIPSKLLPALLSKDRGVHSPDVLIASSYLIGSFSSESEVERLRLLWSGFNAMYRALSPKKLRKEADRLAVMANRAREGKFFRAESQYMRYVDGDSKLLNQLGWYRYTQTKLLHTNKKNNKKELNEDALCSLRFIDRFVSAAIQIELSGKKAEEKKSMKLINLSGTEPPENPDSLLGIILSWAKSPDESSPNKFPRLSAIKMSSPPEELAFLLAHYIYDLRCRYMHGENSYPLYSHPFTEKPLPWLNDILECTLIDYIEAGLTETIEEETHNQ